MTTQRKLPLAAAAGGNAVGFVQLHRILSRENHRLYREGRNYCVKVNAVRMQQQHILSMR